MAENGETSPSGADEGRERELTPTPGSPWQNQLPKTSSAGPAVGKEVGGFRIESVIGKGESATV